MDWATFLSFGGIVVAALAVQTTLLLWMMSKLDSDIRAVSADSNAKWMAVNARIDATQGIIMRMVEKLGK